MGKYYYQKTPILSGAGLVYRNSPKPNAIWQMRLKFPTRLRKSYFIKSTGHRDMGLAIKLATETFHSMLLDLTEGVVPGEKPFNKIYGEFVLEMMATGQVSKASLDVFHHYAAYWTEFFGDTELTAITTTMLSKYVAWRRSYWTTGAGSKKKRRGNVAVNPSHTTMTGDRLRFLQFLKWCHQARYIRVVPVYRPISTSSRLAHNRKVGNRDHFTDVEWRRLRSHLYHYAFGEKKSHNGELHQFQRKTIYYLVMISANLGTRPGETLRMSWRNVNFVQSSQNSDTVKVEVYIPEDTKTGSRTAYGTLNATKYFKELQQLQRETFGADYDENGSVFLRGDGGDLKFPQRTFKNLLKKWDLYKDEEGRTRTLYSLRGLYITFALDRGLTPRVVAKMCGTSIKQIEKHYDRGRVELTDEQLSNVWEKPKS